MSLPVLRVCCCLETNEYSLLFWLLLGHVQRKFLNFIGFVKTATSIAHKIRKRDKKSKKVFSVIMKHTKHRHKTYDAQEHVNHEARRSPKHFRDAVQWARFYGFIFYQTFIQVFTTFFNYLPKPNSPRFRSINIFFMIWKQLPRARRQNRISTTVIDIFAKYIGSRFFSEIYANLQIQ